MARQTNRASAPARRPETAATAQPGVDVGSKADPPASLRAPAPATVSREILEERWRAAMWRPARVHGETGYSPYLTSEWQALSDALDDLAARMLGDEVHGDELETAHDAITGEITEHIHARLVDWADETLNRGATR